ncbi:MULTISPECIES: hypothetical protein [unclassified Streptomyces]|nr:MULTISPECIES: hypothetical protein [unclassified Streptomyces]
MKPSGETFGHEPRDTQTGPAICARCYRYDTKGRDWPGPVIWPCTSVIILGLAPR